MVKFYIHQKYLFILIISGLSIILLVNSCKSSGATQQPATGGEYEITDRAAGQKQDSLLAEKYALKLNAEPREIKQSLSLYKFIDENIETPCSDAAGKNTTTDTKLIQQLYKKVYDRKVPGTYDELRHSNLIPKFSSQSYLAEGDLLFFENKPVKNKPIGSPPEPIQILGIYLKNKKFVTCTDKDGAVAIDDLSQKYWQALFKMAGRLR